MQKFEENNMSDSS